MEQLINRPPNTSHVFGALVNLNSSIGSTAHTLSHIQAVTPYGDTDTVRQIQITGPGPYIDSNSTGNLGGLNFRTTKSAEFCYANTMRYSFWFKVVAAPNDDGIRFYYGPNHSADNGAGSEVTLRLATGQVMYNAYNVGGTINVNNIPKNEWLLCVGYLFKGSTANTTTIQSKIYRRNGTVFLNAEHDFKLARPVRSECRTFFHYGNTPGLITQWYGPRFEVVNGKEIPITSLLNTKPPR